MNNNIEYKYNQFKHILSGCRTLIDAYMFANIYLQKNPEMEYIIYGMINGKHYEDIFDYKLLSETIHNIISKKYIEETNTIIKDLQNKTIDIIQKKTFNRISKNKISKYNDTDLIQNNSNNIIKKCPHCDNKITANINTKYIICGYSDSHKGFDLLGCGKDWCFKCNKKLCKSWFDDVLFIDKNQIHNNNCCKKKAGDKYIEYCNCL